VTTHNLLLSVVLALVAASCVSAFARSQETPAGEETRQLAFDSREALAGWEITGDVTLDMTKGREVFPRAARSRSAPTAWPC